MLHCAEFFLGYLLFTYHILFCTVAQFVVLFEQSGLNTSFYFSVYTTYNLCFEIFFFLHFLSCDSLIQDKTILYSVLSME